VLERLMRKYALSRQGAKDFIKAVAMCTIGDMVLMLPVGLLYFVTNDLLSGVIPKGNIPFYIVAIVVVIALIYMTQFIQYNTTFYTTYKESGNRRVRLAESLRKLPLSFFGKKDLSDLTTNILGDCTTIEQTFSHQMPQFYGSIISTIIVAVGLIIYNPKMALAAIWVIPIALLAVALSKKAQNYFNKRKQNKRISLEDGIQEIIEGMRDLKSYNAEDAALKELDGKIVDFEKESIIAELGVAAFVVPAQMFLKVGIATTVLLGASMLINGELSLISFFAFILVVSRIYEPMSGSFINLGAINAMQVNIDRTNEMNDTKKQEGDTRFEPNGYDIEFNHVGFSYDDGENVLKDVTFTAKQGEVTALIGPSGGGKTTVSRLAARFWDATKGSIRFGGRNIAEIDPETLLNYYSIVFQDVTLFNNSVMENIRIGKKDASDEEVLRAARLANCDDFVNKMPDGYNTIIGENGNELSGGERQRISIARAFLKDAPVILLDEATASLDAENETVIQSAVSRLIEGKTVMVIAHRLRTISGADKIVVLKDGVVKEQGRASELEGRGGIYKEMKHAQENAGAWVLNQ